MAGDVVTGGSGVGSGARRELTVAVVLAVLGSALALLATSRVWVEIETPRPPLPPVREELSGREAVPWAAAMAFVGLAGGIALLATRRIGRTVVGALVGLAGAIMVAGGVSGWTTTGESFERVDVSALWPAAMVVGGVAAFVAGGLAVIRGRRWSGMGARYDAPGSAAEPADAWDALDRGEDPTT